MPPPTLNSEEPVKIQHIMYCGPKVNCLSILNVMNVEFPEE